MDKDIKITLQDRNGNHLSTDNLKIEPLSFDWNLRPDFDVEAARDLRMHRMAWAFGVPPELLRPHVGAIESARQAEIAYQGEINRHIRDWRVVVADQFSPWIELMSNDSIAAAPLYERLYFPLVSRRYQIALGVLMVLVYLVVWLATN